MIGPYIFSQMVVIGHFGQSIWPSTTALILAINVSRWDGFPLEWNMLDGSDYFLSFYIHSTDTQNRVTGLAMWRGLAKRTQRKSKGKTHQNKKTKTQIHLYYYWVGLGPMGLWVVIDQKRQWNRVCNNEQRNFSWGTFRQSPNIYQAELKAGLKPEWDNMGVKKQDMSNIPL